MIKTVPTGANTANPLLRHVYEPTSLDDLAARLSFDPLAGIDKAKLTFMERSKLLDAPKVPLEPTSVSLRAAATIINLVRSHYDRLNPCTPEGRRHWYSGLEGSIQPAAPANPGPIPGHSALVLRGVTGVSKTVTIRHTLRLLGQQVVRHDANEEALWHTCTQLTYLYVGMSSDGTRGGFLENVLLAVEEAIGLERTNDVRRRQKTVEKTMVGVIALLRSLYLGVLVIDEIQLRNLVLAEQAEKMHLFLLTLINSGIPVVLAGNPLGFSWLSTLSQDATRLVAIPPVDFHPEGSIDAPDGDEWDTVFSGIAGYYVLPEPPEDMDTCGVKLKSLSGGIARCALTLWCNAQRTALFSGRQSIRVLDLEDAFNAAAFDDVRDLCRGFANRDPIALMKWRDEDVPTDFYARHWNKAGVLNRVPGSVVATNGRKHSSGVDERGANAVLGGAKRVRQTASAKSKLKASQTRQAKLRVTREEVARQLQADDMRSDGLKSHALASFDRLMADRRSEDPEGGV